jgi:hypothetical protein
MLRWRTMALLWRRALWGGVALGLLFYLALTLWLALSGIFFPYQLDYGEGIVLWFTRELALGHSIYKGLAGLPYASSNYPPLGMLLAVPFRTLFGDSYVGGRWLNFAATLIVAAFIFRIVREESRPSPHPPFTSLRGGRGEGTTAALLSVLFFLGSTFIYHWIPLFRVDLIGLAFTVAGIYFVWRWDRTALDRYGVVRNKPYGLRTTPYLILALLFFLAALYTKHSLLFAPVAASVALFLQDRRAGILFALAFVLSAGGIFLALDVWTRGGFAFGLITSNATLWLWNTFLPLTRDFLWTYLILLAFAVWSWVQRVRAQHFGVLEIYALAALASLGLAGRVGAWENYYFEAIFIVCVFAGLALGALFHRGLAASLWLPLLLLIQLALFWPAHNPALASHLMDYTTAGNQQVAPLVRAATGIVISEDMGLLVTSGKSVEYYTFQYSSLARAGVWDQHWEEENLRGGKFPLVILSQGTREDIDKYRNFTREFASALDFGYGLALEDARYHVYTPSPLQHLQSADFDGQLQLVGWSLTPDQNLRAGQTLTLTVVWRTGRKLRTNYTEFAHLEAANGDVVAQDDHEPRVGLHPNVQPYPTTHWAAGEMVRDTFTLHPSASGTFALRVGWYDSVTQERLSLADGNDFVQLANLEIR